MKKIYTFLGMAFFTLNVFATTLVVNNTNDNGSGSLRVAIINAAIGDTIAFNSSLAGSTINLSSTITINKSLVIDGASSGTNIVVSGSYSFRLFSVTSGQTVYFNNINFTKGQVSTGGAILNSGELILTYCRFYDNTSLVTNNNQGGGAIFNNTNAYLVLNYCEFYENSVISFNSEIPHGGAIYNRGQNVEINFSSFYYNDATSSNGLSSYGGAIHNNSGPLSINSSTFSNNECNAGFNSSTYGGSISTETNSNIVIKNSTLVFNKSISGQNAYGGNISNYGTLSIENTILSGGVANFGPDIHTQNGGGSSTSLGNNLVQYTSGSIISFQSSDIIAAPDVDSLQYINGSFTKVRPINCSSLAVDAGNSGSAPATDQIGQTRNIGGSIDIGAFERQSTVNYYTINPMVCDSYISPSGNYIYTNSANFLDTIYSNSGCMSIITINLTVNVSPNVMASTQNSIICEGDTTQINASGADTYQWNYGIGSGSSKDVSPVANITYVVTGTDSLTGCIDTSSITINVNSLPIPVINQNGNDLTVTNTYSSYQWYLNGNILVGLTTQTITAAQNGNYTVFVTNSAGCSDTSVVYNYTTVGLNEASEFKLEIFPNPAENFLNIRNNEFGTITFYNSIGEQVKIERIKTGNNQITISELPKGFYLLRFVGKTEKVYRSSFIKK